MKPSNNVQTDILYFINHELAVALVEIGVCPLLCMAANDMESARKAAYSVARTAADAATNAADVADVADAARAAANAAWTACAARAAANAAANAAAYAAAYAANVANAAAAAHLELAKHHLNKAFKQTTQETQ